MLHENEIDTRKVEDWSYRLRIAIEMTIDAHQFFAKTSKKTIRYWNKETPYSVHPVWCAMTFLQETELPESIDRETGALALLWHDVAEDTTQGPESIPDWICSHKDRLVVVELVRQMTFTGEAGSTAIEIQEIWDRPPIIRLLKLYDKTSNLLDGTWMSDEKWNEQYVPYVLELADDVEANFGKLNIVRIARAVAKPRKNKKGEEK